MIKKKKIIEAILIKDAKLNPHELPQSEDINNIINETLEKQQEVLKLNKIDQDELRMIVQL
ncbi:MAG: hypothetical protein JXQ93_01515 [Flavobacteriaceae bacterium]